MSRLRQLPGILRARARPLATVLRWAALGCLVGCLAGLSSAAFLATLTWATRTRESHPWMLWLLPLAGAVVGLAYHYGGGRAGQGNALIIDEIHEPRAWVPRRMAPLIFSGTVVTHLFGGSAGREGTALQMAGSLTDLASRLLRLSPDQRRLLLIAALAGGFGAVFGVPAAGCVFALEVQAIGRMRYDALVPALAASVVGDGMVRLVGVTHTRLPPPAPVSLSALVLVKVALAGVAFGALATLFSEATHRLKALLARRVAWPPLRPVLGGMAVIVLAAAVGSRAYLGLSLPLITQSLAGGAGVAGLAFAAKGAFTVVTLGSGFQGGEVTPLFVIGATAGASFARVLHLPVPMLAAVGFVAVFGAAANTPLACTVMALELFGSPVAVPALVGCVVAYVSSSARGIYVTQRVATPKAGLVSPGPSAPTARSGSARARRRGRAGGEGEGRGPGRGRAPFPDD